MDLVDTENRVKGLVLVITLTNETNKHQHEYGMHTITTHKPEVRLFNSIIEANKYLQEESRSVLGVWELTRDLSGALVRDRLAVNQERTIIDVGKLVLDKG